MGGIVRWLSVTGNTVAARYRPLRPGIKHSLRSSLIVSLTSYKPRFLTLSFTLRCLLSQDVQPDALVLWVAHEDRSSLPDDVVKLQRYGVIIRECDDLGSYKKIIPGLDAYPGAFIATADDDIAYPRDWLRRLLGACRSEREIVGHYGRRIKFHANQLAPYEQWCRLSSDAAGKDVFLIGMGGVLYPPGSLPLQTGDKAAFMRLCPHADDIWLHWMGSLAGCTFRCVRPPREFVPWGKSQRIALWRTNVAAGRNDEAVAAMVNSYGHPLLS